MFNRNNQDKAHSQEQAEEHCDDMGPGGGLALHGGPNVGMTARTLHVARIGADWEKGRRSKVMHIFYIQVQFTCTTHLAETSLGGFGLFVGCTLHGTRVSCNFASNFSGNSIYKILVY